jgi:hypothetical protein
MARDCSLYKTVVRPVGNWSKDEGGIRQRLSELKEEGELEGFEREADKVQGLLISPDNIHVAIDALEQLEEKIKKKDVAHRKTLAPYEHKLGIWTKQGFDTTGLSVMLVEKDTDMKTIDKVFWRFEKMVERVVNIEKTLFEMETPQFEVDIEALREMMTAPARLGEVARRYHHLVQRINAFNKEQTRRKELDGTVIKYQSMGYRVDSALRAKSKDLQAYENAVAELEDAVVILEDLEERLNAILSSVGRSDRTDYLRDILKDPERMAEAMDEVDRLEKSR